MSVDDRRIVRIPISSEDIIERNLRLFHNPDVYYDTIHTYRRTLWEIRKDENEYKLQKIIDEFPYDRPIEEQCAYWVRAISGVHPFPDANHRTATQTLWYILYENGFEVGEWRDESVGDFVNASKNLKRYPYRIDVSLDNLRREDAIYETWKWYFWKELK